MNRTCRIAALFVYKVFIFCTYVIFFVTFLFGVFGFVCVMVSLKNRTVSFFISFCLFCFFSLCEYFRVWKIKSRACRHNQHNLTPEHIKGNAHSPTDCSDFLSFWSFMSKPDLLLTSVLTLTLNLVFTVKYEGLSLSLYLPEDISNLPSVRTQPCVCTHCILVSLNFTSVMLYCLLLTSVVFIANCSLMTR